VNQASLHIAPVGLRPVLNYLKDRRKLVVFQMKIKTQFVTGLSPIPALTCPDAPELGLPSSHSYGYGFQSRPAFSRIWPASELGILVQYAG
jgi:hypothetical protein